MTTSLFCITPWPWWIWAFWSLFSLFMFSHISLYLSLPYLSLHFRRMPRTKFIFNIAYRRAIRFVTGSYGHFGPPLQPSYCVSIYSFAIELRTMLLITVSLGISYTPRKKARNTQFCFALDGTSPSGVPARKVVEKGYKSAGFTVAVWFRQ